jgi:hypothetical protein
LLLRYDFVPFDESDFDVLGTFSFFQAQPLQLTCVVYI